jgi:hypothetical protein
MVWFLGLLTLIVLAGSCGRGDGRRRLAYGLALQLVLYAGMAISACGGGMTQSQPPPVINAGTPKGTYTLTVTATFTPAAGTGSAVSRSTQLTLVVQ